MFRDGDTPKVIRDYEFYEVTKVTQKGICSYGTMRGHEVKDILKGFHYEELFRNSGMWYSNSVKYAYDVVMV